MNTARCAYHIFNGDFALKLWRQKMLPGESLVWREIYLEGPLPDTEDLACFRWARAKYLSAFAELSPVDEAQIFRQLEEMDNWILQLPENSTLQLWFDSCIFDQTILMRILYLLDRKRDYSIWVSLYCCEGCCLSLEDFERGIDQSVKLDPEDWALGKRAWECFRSQEAEKMLQLAQQEKFEHLLQMKKALFRCAEEVPDSNGLTRTQRQILELIAKGNSGFVEIFQGLDAYEETPFLGDTSCQRQLDFLVKKDLVTVSPDHHYYLTPSDLF